MFLLKGGLTSDWPFRTRPFCISFQTWSSTFYRKFVLLLRQLIRQFYTAEKLGLDL